MDWIVIVDDDADNRSRSARILKKNGFEVTELSGGKELLSFVEGKNPLPDLILLDLLMPEMDGFETLTLLQGKIGKDTIPVIYLTGEEDHKQELAGLRLGARDFIRKPYFPEILLYRVKQTIGFFRLQKDLRQEVERVTAAHERLTLHVVETLAEAIDAKDTYTNGHSGRVAAYSRELAKRMGYNEETQEQVYMMGLLHDVGKIGVPDEIINKPDRLTDEEFAEIKKHPVVGDRILKKIRDNPALASGARWHHERYDGKGYPDGLSGTDIPEEARIIAVADAYDAMTSNRSYRRAMPQEKVKEQMENGKGSQFDPAIAELMIQMIEEDKDYEMKEHA